ncbi:MAG: hypothetical protein ACE5DX_04605 [Candidatus Dojkabacteria bacterium]
MTIHPALLVDSLSDFESQLKHATKFVKDIDVDIIDWSRTDNKTLTAEGYLSVESDLDYHFDLMMDEPSKTFPTILEHSRVKTVTVNLATQENVIDLIKQIQAKEKFAGISVNPDNTWEQIEEYMDLVEFIQIMTINPGKQGNPFMPEMLERVQKLADSEFNGLIGIDGGVNFETLQTVVDYPVDLISVGSAISKADDPVAAYKQLMEIVEKRRDLEEFITF